MFRNLIAALILVGTTRSLCAMSTGPHIKVVQLDAPASEVDLIVLGQAYAVSAEGLEPDKSYEVHAEWHLGGKISVSNATFRADGNGSFNSATQAPEAGSYQGVDPDGLFWSMNSTERAAPDMTAKFIVKLVDGDDELHTQVLAHSFIAKNIAARELPENSGAVGGVFANRDGGKRPAVIYLGGSEGGYRTAGIMAAHVANHGFTAIALGYFAAPGLPSQLGNIPLEYFANAIKVIQTLPEVDPSKIAVVGVSRGSELALLLASKFPQIRAAVAQAPTDLRWGGNPPYDESGNLIPAWTQNGEALPFMGIMGGLTEVKLPDGRIAYNNRPAFEETLRKTPKETIQAAAIELEKINGPILMLGGGDDQVWPACDFIESAKKRLAAKKRKYRDETVCYPAAGHGVAMTPGLSTMQSVTYHPQMKILVNMGGTPAANAFAQRDGWNKVIEFLKQSLR